MTRSTGHEGGQPEHGWRASYPSGGPRAWPAALLVSAGLLLAAALGHTQPATPPGGPAPSASSAAPAPTETATATPPGAPTPPGSSEAPAPTAPPTAEAPGAPTPPASGEAPAPTETPTAAPSPPASTAPATPAPPVDEAKLAEARRLFEQGNEMRKTGDFERALHYYVASRKIVRSVASTLNAAVCLDELERYDEALELFEELLTTMRDRLTDADRATIASRTAKLRALVGSVDVQANTDGALVIDGRPRGKLPLMAPVRVLPGKHRVLVTKDGYRSFEITVDVTVGAVARVVARLEPLAAAGRLQIVDPLLLGAEVFVDGADVGRVPWEGSLEPGAHYFQLRKGDTGTGLQPITIVMGQVAVVSGQLVPLGPELRVVVEPPTAELQVGGVRVGQGGWQGRLPLGNHVLEAREEGYVSARQDVRVASDMKGEIQVRLTVDEEHPRWRVEPSGHFWLDLVGGLAIVPSLSSGPEQSCGTSTEQGRYECSSDPAALGFLTALRGGYELPIGVSIELGLGYLQASKTLERTYDAIVSLDAAHPNVPVRYSMTDELRFAGPFAAAGAGYRVGFAEVFELRTHLLLGALWAIVNDDLTATASTGETVPASVNDSDRAPADPLELSATILIMPEAHIGLRFGAFGVSVGATAAIIAVSGATFDHDQLAPTGACPGVVPGQTPSPSCLGERPVVRDERSFGPFIAVVPSLSASYLF